MDARGRPRLLEHLPSQSQCLVLGSLSQGGLSLITKARQQKSLPEQVAFSYLGKGQSPRRNKNIRRPDAQEYSLLSARIEANSYIRPPFNTTSESRLSTPRKNQEPDKGLDSSPRHSSPTAPKKGSKEMTVPISPPRKPTKESHPPIPLTRRKSTFQRGLTLEEDEETVTIAPPLTAPPPPQRDVSERTSLKKSMSGQTSDSEGDDLPEGSVLDEEEHKEVDITTSVRLMTRPYSVWDPQEWKDLLQQSLETHHSHHSHGLEDIRALMSAIHKSTQQAIAQGFYVTDTATRVNMKCRPMQIAQWFGESNVELVDVPKEGEEGSSIPPLIVADCEPLEVVRRLRQNSGSSRQINVLTEITAFDRHTGDISKQCTALSAQQSSLLQTDFGTFLGTASRQMHCGQSSIEQHLRASHDPYVCLCPEVTLFRGTREDGYPFLDDPFTMNVIISSLTEERPHVIVSGDGSEWYTDEKDQTALLERLNLIGLVALQQQAADSDELPILVLSALGCTTGGGHHPRDAVANSLKHWRLRYARHFHCVIVACGTDRELALQFDAVINEQVYETLSEESLRDIGDLVELSDVISEMGKWHWDGDLLALHVRNFELQRAGRIAKDWHEQVEKKRKEEEEAAEAERQAKRELEAQLNPDSPTLHEHETDLLEGSHKPSKSQSRFSLKLNGNFFMNSALRENQEAIRLTSKAPSRVASPQGSRANSPHGSRSGTPDDGSNRGRLGSLALQKRQSSIGGSHLEVDLMDDPLRRKSWGGIQDPNQKSARGSLARGSLLIPGGTDVPPGADMQRRASKSESHQRHSIIAMAGRRKSSQTHLANAGRRKSSTGDPNGMEGQYNGMGRRGSMRPPGTDEPQPQHKDSKSIAEDFMANDDKLELTSAEKTQMAEDLRKKARDQLRARKSSVNNDHVTTPDANLDGEHGYGTTMEDSVEKELKEENLVEDIEKLTEKVQNALTSKRSSISCTHRQSQARISITKEESPEEVKQIEPQVVRSSLGSDGCVSLSLSIPQVRNTDDGIGIARRPSRAGRPSFKFFGIMGG